MFIKNNPRIQKSRRKVSYRKCNTVGILVGFIPVFVYKAKLYWNKGMSLEECVNKSVKKKNNVLIFLIMENLKNIWNIINHWLNQFGEID